MRPFLENPDAAGPAFVGRYYAQVSRDTDAQLWEARDLVYGILEVEAGMIGREWVTFPGHLHRGPRRTVLPAVAEVIHGEGAAYLQGAGSRSREESIVWLRQGHRIFLPPGFVHTFINRTDEPFILAEVHSAATEADFLDVARHRGMGHYWGPEGPRPNPHYVGLSAVREVEAVMMAAPKTPGRDLYQAVLRNPEQFRFLHPF